MYSNQTDTVHLKSLNVLLSLIILNLSSVSLCWAGEVNTAPIQAILSQHYNSVIKVNLPTIVIKTTSFVEHSPISIKDVLVNDGKCRTNSKRRHLLPRKLHLGQSIEIGLMLGCHVKTIIVQTERNTKTQSWKFLISTNYIDVNETEDTDTSMAADHLIGDK